MNKRRINKKYSAIASVLTIVGSVDKALALAIERPEEEECMLRAIIISLFARNEDEAVMEIIDRIKFHQLDFATAHAQAIATIHPLEKITKLMMAVEILNKKEAGACTSC